MPAVFTFNGFSHPAAEVSFANISRAQVLSQTQRPYLLQVNWSMKGHLVAQGSGAQAALLAALAVRIAAYSSPGAQASMVFDTGQSPFVLGGNNAIGLNNQKVVVTSQISHGVIDGSQGSTWLDYTFGLQSTYFLASANDLLTYSEVLSFADCGGGPLKAYRTPVVGLPIVQSISTSSFFEATQSGSASSLNPNIQPEDMIYPNFLKGEPGARHVSSFSPKTERGQPIEYGVNWSYQYKSPISFSGGSVHIRG